MTNFNNLELRYVRRRLANRIKAINKWLNSSSNTYSEVEEKSKSQETVTCANIIEKIDDMLSERANINK